MLRFKQYLALQARFWSEDDTRVWNDLQAKLQVSPSEDAFVHAWIVHALNTKRLTMKQVAVWLMQYPAGQVVVASRWPQAPHTVLGLLYPDWSKAQHTKSALGLPWYNGAT